MIAVVAIIIIAIANKIFFIVAIKFKNCVLN